MSEFHQKQKEAIVQNLAKNATEPEIAEYLYIKKPDPDRPKSLFVKYMHGIVS